MYDYIRFIHKGPISMTVQLANDEPVALAAPADALDRTLDRAYDAGFVTDIESDVIPAGLDEDVVRLISLRKREPPFMLEWRLAAYAAWTKMKEPQWGNVRHPPIDYQAISYFSQPKSTGSAPKSLADVDPKLLETYEKLGIPLHERAALAGVAVDAVFDSVSVVTTFRKQLAEAGVIFCSLSEALQDHPELVRRYLGSVVPVSDNFFAALNSAVFSDGSFVYIPKGVKCPMELSSYFRINTAKTGQFERTLIIAEEGASVSYLEGCTAPKRDENQLHAAVVELVALDDATIKYSTVQNWYPGDQNGLGGIYNFVTKRGHARGRRSRITWTQVETGAAITWKYPSCWLIGEGSVGEFYSVAVSNHHQQADTGTKMVHIGRNTRSTIISKGISAGHGRSTYRGLVKAASTAAGRPQLHPVRLAADRQRVRSAYLSHHPERAPGCPFRTRGQHLARERRPDVLLPPARPDGRRHAESGGQRLLQERVQAIADGIRRGGAEPPERQS